MRRIVTKNIRNKIFRTMKNPVFCDVIKGGISTEKSAYLELEKKCVAFEGQLWGNKLLFKHAIASFLSLDVNSIKKITTLIKPSKRKSRKNKIYHTPTKKIVRIFLKNVNNGNASVEDKNLTDTEAKLGDSNLMENKKDVKKI